MTGLNGKAVTPEQRQMQLMREELARVRMACERYVRVAAVLCEGVKAGRKFMVVGGALMLPREWVDAVPQRYTVDLEGGKIVQQPTAEELAAAEASGEAFEPEEREVYVLRVSEKPSGDVVVPGRPRILLP